ncbi:DegV family EDD domain-containing protein [Lachnospiraceae bacterium MD308]|nr:DegV family EDD domain-containing protein [Lachnospiraceae bacterium MD308]
MGNIILLAETGSDITKEVADKYGIYIVPMHVSFGEETRDDATFPAEEVCEFYERTGILPKTSGSVPEDFEKIFDRIHKEHPDGQILYLAYSSVTTCSYQSGQIAAQGRDYVTSIDTKHVSVGQYAVVVTMAELLKKHPEWTVQEAALKAKEVSESVRMCFVPDKLEFLRAGGRVSNAAALCGALLKIHPQIDILDGYLTATKKHRGSMKKIVSQLTANYIREQKLNLDEIWLICSPRMSEEVRQKAERAALDCGAKKITWVQTGCVITSHGGPGAFGVVGISEKM